MEATNLEDNQTKGQKRAIADQGGTSNPLTIGRSSPAKRKEITLKESTQTANAFVRGANLDTSMMYMGSIMSFLVRAQDTDGRFAMVEYRARPGNEPPPHVHLWEHEIFSVLEGKIEFHCEDQVETVGPGETIFLPKGKAHAFYIRTEYLRTLIISLATTEQPAALDSYFASMAKRATSMDIPTDAVTYLTDDPSHAIEAGEKYGIKCCRLKRQDGLCRISAGSAQTSPRIRSKNVVP